MILSNVNIGTGPSAGDGDPLRSAFITINNNFQTIENNVNALTNSVNTVAGRTGNVILTVNDIVGLNSTYSTQANVTAANVGMRGYVDSKITANIALLVNSAPSTLDTIRELADAIGDDPNFAVNIALSVSSANTKMRGYVDGQITAANAGVTAANLGMKGYVDSVAGGSYSNVNVTSFLPTYGGNIKVTGILNGGNAIHMYNTLHIQGDSGGNGLFVGDPDVEINPYGNSIASFHGNVNAPVYLNVHNKNSGALSLSGIALTSDVGDTSNDSLVLAVVGSGYNDANIWPNVKPLDSVIDSTEGNLWIGTLGKAINFYIRVPEQIQFVSIDKEPGVYSGNLNIHRYVDLNFLDANSKIRFGDNSIQTTAYTGYGNTHVGAYTNLSTYAYNANVTAANLGMKGYVDSVASQSIYGNGNVLSYLTQFDGNIVPSANVTYSLGNITNRWKDLYLSGNTIFLGDATITTEGGRLVTTGAAISPPTGAVAFANVQFEAATNFEQIRSYYVDNNFGYTANLTSWTTAPIVWDELRSAKIKINSSIVAGSTPDFASLDTSGGRFANAVATLDATGNIASLTITDGGVGYDAYYPYYAADSTGYDTNYIGQSYTGSPTGKSFRRIGLIPTTASDVGNITSIGSFTRYSDLPTVGTNSYTWTGNTGTTISFTVDWASNTVTAYTYTPALPALTSAQEWQDWILDYQSTNDYGWIIGSGSITGGGGTPIQAVYDYLSREALPTSLTYDQSATTWYPGNLLINNASVTATLSSSTFFITFNRTSINYATLENSYGNPVYWSRGLSADTGISSGGDMTVAGDLRVAGDLYVSPDSIYLGDLQLSSIGGNLIVHGNIIPSANVTYSLGSITNQWKDLFVSNNTIFIGGVPLSIDAAGNLLVNGNAVSGGGGTATGIESASTISITNADSSADINILSGDDITIQGKNKTISDSEGGDITINAGNGGDADAGDAAGSGGDITIRAGQGGIPSAAYNGGFGGTLDLYGGTGGDSDPGNNRTARDGGRARLQAGSAGSNNGDIELGAVGGPVEITAGQTTLANAIGGAVTITSGQAGANALAGYVEINIPSSDLGQGGSWYFTGTGRTLEAPQDGEIWQPNAGNLSVASAGNVFIRSYDGIQHEWQFGHTGDLTLPGSIVNGNSELNFVASSSGDGGGYTTMQLVPDNTVTGPDQYIIIDPTIGAPAGHIHIRAGGTQDDSSANLYLGGENSYFGIPHGSNPNVTVAANSHEWIFGADGNITFPDSTVQTTAWTGDTYSNVQVATYLPTYTGNVAAGNVKVSTAYRFETGNVTITNESGYVSLNPDTTLSGTAGVKIGGSGFLLGPNGARNLTLNYGGISGALGIQANVTIGTGGSGNLFVVGNVIARDITGGNILATGTSGVIGFNSGGFVQQATSNATQVTSNTSSGNIQLMSIDLGASAVHTVTFACNKLTTNDILLVKHVSGGVTSVYVDAYVVSDGLAVIWMRDITGQNTGAFTPMLKYAIVRAPSA